jgi:hypothetical protein
MGRKSFSLATPASIIITLTALFLSTQIAQSLADEVINVLPIADPTPAATDSAAPVTPTPSDTPAPTETASPTAEPAPSDSPSPTTEPSASPSPTPSPTETPPAPEPNQQMILHVPSVVKVDPRARAFFMPQIDMYGAGNLLVCASSPNLIFDVGQKNLADGPALPFLKGEFTTNLVVGGQGFSAAWILNSDGGLKVIGAGTSVGNKSVLLRFVLMTKPSADAKFCSAARSSNTRIVQISPLDLGMDLPKGDVSLK